MQDTRSDRKGVKSVGYVFMTAACHVCGSLFLFNPMKVPSLRDGNGVRHPVCKLCVELANVMRSKAGVFEPFPIVDGAYEPCDEGELP